MKFYHYHPRQKGGVTLCWNIQETSNGKFLEIAFAQCSDKDQYCKKTGRDLCLDKYLKGEITIISVKGSLSSIRKRVSKEVHLFAYTIYKMQSNHENI